MKVAAPVYEEGIVQYVKLVVHQTELESLLHLVCPALPGEPLVVCRLPVGPDVDRLPVVEGSLSLGHVEHVEAGLDLRCRHPLSGPAEWRL